MGIKTTERMPADEELRIVIGKPKGQKTLGITHANTPFILRAGGTKYALPLDDPFIPPAIKNFKSYEEWGARMLEHFASAGKPARSIRIDDAFVVPLIVRAKTDAKTQPAPIF